MRIPATTAAADRQAGTGNAEDDEILRKLAVFGAMSKPRHFVNFLYFPDEESAKGIARFLAELDWNVEINRIRRGKTWLLVADMHDCVLSEDAVRDARIFFEELASIVPGASYDGWQASA